MMPLRRHWIAAASLVAMIGAAGCKDRSAKLADPPAAGPLAAASGPALAPGFETAPLLAHVPADTPYVFASFQSLPADFWRQMGGLYQPVFDAVRTQIAVATGGDDKAATLWEAVTAELPTLDRAHLEQLGISPQGRIALYGLGAYPVFRIELGDGERLLAAVQRVAARVGQPMPAPRQDGERSYWEVPLEEDRAITALIAVAPRELVLAVVPTSRLPELRPLVLGAERPVAALDPQVLRDLARRGGYAPHGVGFLDTRRMIDVIAAATGKEMSAACRTAVGAVATALPRITLGFGDLTKEFAFGYGLELAPQLAAEVGGLALELPDLAASDSRQPVFEITAAMDVERGRALLARAGGELESLGAACAMASLSDGGRAIAHAAASPLPPAWASVRGGSVALYALEMGEDWIPSRIEAMAILSVDDPGRLLAMAPDAAGVSQLALDGKPRKLPLPIATDSFVAANANTIALGIGPGSDQRATAALALPRTRAPLLRFGYSLRDLEPLLARATSDTDRALVRAAVGTMGTTGLEVTATPHGVFLWGRMAYSTTPPAPPAAVELPPPAPSATP